MKEKLSKVWKSSGCGCGSRKFLTNSSILRDRAFSDNLGYISGESDRIVMKILSQMYTWTRKSY